MKHKGEKERQKHMKAEQQERDKNSKEQQGEIRKSSSEINANKQRKTTEWERLNISSRKLEMPGENQDAISCKDGLD